MSAFLMAACGGGDDNDAADREAVDAPTTTNSGSVDAVSAKVARDWPRKWCLAAPGNTREQVREVMGEPTTEFGAEQDEWSAFNLSFTAFYDAHGEAYQLQTDASLWSAEDKSKLTCDEVRKI